MDKGREQENRRERERIDIYSFHLIQFYVKRLPLKTVLKYFFACFSIPLMFTFTFFHLSTFRQSQAPDLLSFSVYYAHVLTTSF